MEKVYSIRTWLCALVILVVHFAIAAMAESSNDSLVRSLAAISRDGDDVLVHKRAILARPAAEVRNVLEEMLESDGGQAMALRAIEILQLKGFDEKLRDLVKTTNAADIVLAVNKLSRDTKTIDVYRSRLQQHAGKSQHSALKISFLSGLAEFTEPISAQLFESLLNDGNEKVREAALLHLAATSTAMTPADRSARLKRALKSNSPAIRKIAQDLQITLRKNSEAKP